MITNQKDFFFIRFGAILSEFFLLHWMVQSKRIEAEPKKRKKIPTFQSEHNDLMEINYGGKFGFHFPRFAFGRRFLFLKRFLFEESERIGATWLFLFPLFACSIVFFGFFCRLSDVVHWKMCRQEEHVNRKWKIDEKTIVKWVNSFLKPAFLDENRIFFASGHWIGMVWFFYFLFASSAENEFVFSDSRVKIIHSLRVYSGFLRFCSEFTISMLET